jgi:hypothetical protein
MLMARWTSSRNDELKIAKANEQIPVGGILRIKLTNGTIVEGVLRGMRVGNDAGQGGVWKYYGESDLQTLGKQTITVDHLDIDTVENIWDEAHEQYVSEGIILAACRTCRD